MQATVSGNGRTNTFELTSRPGEGAPRTILIARAAEPRLIPWS